MAAAAAAEPPRLAALLESGWQLLDEVEASVEPAAALQERVRRGLELLQQAARRVAQLELFSQNEELEEIASADLKYLLLPALLGALTLKQINLSKRLEHVQSARAHFMNFLKLCKSYQIGKFQLPETPQSPDENESSESTSKASPAVGQPSLVAMAVNRQAKIERYKQKKEVENRLASMKAFVESGQADEEQVREFYLLHIQKWISTSLDEIESIDQEMVILRGRDAIKQSSASSHAPRQPRTPMKPFILTRDAAQAKVFGAGYPSLATMTVDDWYEQHQKRGLLPDQGVPRGTPAEVADEELEQEQQEKKVEEDNEETLRKARGWDDWKDTHPRGYGNRQNMG
ncbi:PREDICTED: immunoglobulin-binding protein 1 isoform X1 [Crocodylus porosus]|uniref:Immunoglobulin binding protein 1 n=1 Tax=Crocodylus porosus TaxID=8502 RepID=A0A7M4EPN8_CROPO|nr:PREDICTED: immunoglobulin-binding protein 1 isoform X1 [Crocodylus porosus]